MCQTQDSLHISESGPVRSGPGQGQGPGPVHGIQPSPVTRKVCVNIDAETEKGF